MVTEQFDFKLGEHEQTHKTYTLKTAIATPGQVDVRKQEAAEVYNRIKPISLPNSTYRVVPWFEYTPTDTVITYDVYNGLGTAITVPDYIKFVRPKIKIVIRVSAVLNQYGYMIVSWTPHGMTGGHEEINANPIIIDLGVNGVHEIEVPFVNIHNFAIWSSIGNYSPQLHMVSEVGTVDTVGPRAVVAIERQILTLGARGVAAQSSTAAGILAGAAVLTGTLKTVDQFIDSAKSVAASVQGVRQTAQETYDAFSEMVDEAGKMLDEQGWYDYDGDGKIGIKEEATHHGGLTYVATNPVGALNAVHVELENFNTVKYMLPPDTRGDKNLRHYIKEIIKVPQISFYGSAIVSGYAVTNTNYIPVRPVLPGLNYQNGFAIDWVGNSTHLSIISQMFAWWRGTLKYKLIHYLSPLTTAKLEITVTYRPLLGNATRTDYEYFMVKTLNGTTETDIEVPFLWDDDWMTTSADDTMYDTEHYNWPGPILTTPTGDATLPYAPRAIANIAVSISNMSATTYPMKVPWLIINAPGEDFQLRRYYPRKTLVTAQMRVSESTFNCPIIEKAGAISRYKLEEDEMTLEDVGRRWSQWYRTLPHVYHHIYDPYWETQQLYGELPMDIYIAQMFAFIRGGFDFKFLGEIDAEQRGISYFTTVVNNYTNLASTAANISPNGMIARQQSQNNVLEGTAYMEGPTEWFYTYRSQVPQETLNMSVLVNYNNAGVTAFSRFGKSIQLAYLLPPYKQEYSAAYIQ